MGVSELDVPRLLVTFTRVPDPRANNARHYLEEILCIAVCAVIAGADSFTDIEAFGRSKEAWFRKFLRLPHGIPRHDTFNRVFASLNPGAWQACFLEWVRSLNLPASTAPVDTIAVDGKTARRSGGRDFSALHTVSAWSSEHGVVLGQAQVREKSNEITVIPDLLEALDIAGATVTIDAMGTQKQIAWVIREHHADYVLALKENHPRLHEDVRWLFEQQDREPDWRQESAGHGRLELRETWLLTDLDFLEVSERRAWRDLRGVARVRGSRVINGQSSSQDRYFLTSHTDAEKVAYAVRRHWGIENELHWVLDIVFGEDQSRARMENAQANLVTVRHLALSLLKREPSEGSLKGKRKRAGWDDDFLLAVLNA